MSLSKNIAHIAIIIVFLFVLLHPQEGRGSPTDEILCQGFLSKLSGVKTSSCTNSSGLSPGSNCNPTLTDGDNKDTIYTVSDNITLLHKYLIYHFTYFLGDTDCFRHS